MNNQADINYLSQNLDPEKGTVETLQLIQLDKKKPSKNDSQLEKEMRRFNKLVKELGEQEKENALQQIEEEEYHRLFITKVQPLLIDLAATQLRFIEKLEEIFYGNKFSKNLERAFIAFAIPILQDASIYLDAAKDKMNNYINWQESLFKKADKNPMLEEEDDKDEEKDADSFREKKYSSDNYKDKLPGEWEKKSVSDLYKELAKLIHPDLEQDESQRYHKEQLMKELTAAKNKADVHAMLLIQQKAAILNKTGPSEKSYSLQLLKLYNDAMKKKLQELKRTFQQKIFNSFSSKESFFAQGRKKIAVEIRIKNDVHSIKELSQNLQVNTRIISTGAQLKELLQEL